MSMECLLSIILIRNKLGKSSKCMQNGTLLDPLFCTLKEEESAKPSRGRDLTLFQIIY